MPETIGKIGGAFLGKALSPSMPTFNAGRTINTPAFTLQQGGGTVGLERKGPGRFPGILGELETLKADVSPGFGKFTESIKKQFGELRARTLGNARDALTRRRVAGANFASNQLASLDAEVTRQENQALSGAFIKEIETSRLLIDQSFKTAAEGIRLDLEELRIATGASDTIMKVLGEQAIQDKLIAAKSIEQTGAFFSDAGGQLFGGEAKDSFAEFTSGIGNLFGGGGAPARQSGSINDPVIGAERGIR